MTNSIRHRADVLQDRHGLKITSYLTLSANELSHDVSERLRISRTQALSQRKLAKTSFAPISLAGGGRSALTWGGDEGLGWLGRLGSVLPLVALVAGLLFINAEQNDDRARELAEVDVALLTDELPPAAFADPGFLQFLKSDL
jgi:hypothetical protein